MDRVWEYAALSGRSDGTYVLTGDEAPFVLQAGVPINIPLASTRERRAHVMKAVEETRAMDEIRGRVLADIARLRQHEADLTASAARLKFCADKSGWLQQRVEDDFGDPNRSPEWRCPARMPQHLPILRGRVARPPVACRRASVFGADHGRT